MSLAQSQSIAVFAGTRPRRPRPGRTRGELPAGAASAHGAAPDEVDLHGVTILIVEDHPDSRDLLCQIVESFGAKVATAADGREALATARRLQPDLILCDLRMPVLDGFGFMERLRHDPDLSRTAVLAVTALAGEADVRRTWEAGFDGHLIKPVDYTTMGAQLQRLFSAHPRKPAT